MAACVLSLLLTGCQTWEEDSGTFEVDWKLIDDLLSTSDGDVFDVEGTCEEWGVSDIAFAAHHEDGDTFDELFPCAAGAGFSRRVPLGSYVFECRALDASGGEVARADMSVYQDYGLSDLEWDDDKLSVGCRFYRD